MKIKFFFRYILIIFCAAVFLIGTSACNESKSDNDEKNKTITVASFAGPEAEAVEKLAPEFTQETGIKINFVTLPYEDLFSKGIISASSNEGLYDLLFIDDPKMPVFAQGDYLHSLSNFEYNPEDDDFIEGALQVDQWPPPKSYEQPEETTEKKDFYGLPVTGNVSMFFYDKEAAKKHDVDTDNWTWEDVNKVAKDFSDPSKDQYGHVLRGEGGNDLIADFTSILRSYGGSFYKEDGTSNLDSPEALAALEEWMQLYQYGPDGQSSFGADEVGTYMKQKKSATAIVWPSGWAENMPDTVGITMMPGIEGEKESAFPTIGVWSLGIPKNAENPEEAFKFMKWVTDKEQQLNYANEGTVPTRKSAIKDSDVINKYPYYEKALESLQKGRMRPRSEGFTYAMQTLGDEIVEVELGNESPEEALQKVSKKIDRYMENHDLIKK